MKLPPSTIPLACPFWPVDGPLWPASPSAVPRSKAPRAFPLINFRRSISFHRRQPYRSITDRNSRVLIQQRREKDEGHYTARGASRETLIPKLHVSLSITA